MSPPEFQISEPNEYININQPYLQATVPHTIPRKIPRKLKCTATPAGNSDLHQNSKSSHSPKKKSTSFNFKPKPQIITPPPPSSGIIPWQSLRERTTTDNSCK